MFMYVHVCKVYTVCLLIIENYSFASAQRKSNRKDFFNKCLKTVTYLSQMLTNSQKSVVVFSAFPRTFVTGMLVIKLWNHGWLSQIKDSFYVHLSNIHPVPSGSVDPPWNSKCSRLGLNLGCSLATLVLPRFRLEVTVSWGLSCRMF